MMDAEIELLLVVLGAAFCIVTAGVHFVSILIVTVRGRFAVGRIPAKLPAHPPVSILRPLCGLDNVI